MIKPYTPDQIFQLFQASPADIQDATISARTADRLRNIALVKHELSIEQLGKMAQLLGLVLFGLLHPDELTENLQKELNIEPARAKALYRDIWEAILKPVEGSLRRIHGPIKAVEEIEIEAEFKPPPAPSLVRPLPPKPPIAKIEEIKKEAVTPPVPSRVEVLPPKPTPPLIRPVPPPIRPMPPTPPPAKKVEAMPKREAYLEPIEEEIKPPVPAPPRPAPPKPEKIEIGGIPVEVVQKKEAPERPVTPPRISALYLEPIEEEEPPSNVVDLRSK